MFSDYQTIFIWWSVFFLVGTVTLPSAYLIFKNPVLSFGFSKTLGFLFITFAVFVLSTLKIVPLANTSLYVLLAIWTGINTYIYAKNKDTVTTLIRKNFFTLVVQELLFASGLVGWSIIRSYQPDILGLEKLMDFGFINSILRTKYLPPVDMWFAGKAINYYWFGHLWVAVATKLTGIPSYITYNLMLATIMGLSLSGAYAISSTLIKNLKPHIKARTVFAVGIISALALTFAGNFHTPLYVLKDGRDRYWYPDATRFIGYNPDTNDKTIHEFPIYSFVVSDLHPHLINFPFVLLFIGLLVAFTSNYEKINFKKIALMGFMLGIFFMANTWDFGNYALVSGIVLFVFNIKRYGFKIQAFITTALQGIVMLSVSLVTSLGFLLNFESIAQGVALVRSHSPLWQLAVLWGFPAILSIIFLLSLYREKINFKKIKSSDLLVICLMSAAWLLIALPEVIYVKDIYIASHYRANTMFKLTYQAFVMFYTLSGYIALRALIFLKQKLLKVMLVVLFVLLFGVILSYPSFAIKSYYGDLNTYKGLNGETWLSQTHPEAYGVVDWMRRNVKDQPVILEAPGDSYTDFDVISSYTGLPTVSGWFVHEWLWRGDAKFPQARVADIDLIYQSPDAELTKSILAKYNVSYIIVGPFEFQKFPLLQEEKIKSLGRVVYKASGITVYKLN